MLYPQFQVLHVTYIPNSVEVFVIQAQNNPDDAWNVPTNFPQTIKRLGLQAASNLPAYPNAYVVGAHWTTAAAAKAAAQADYAALVADKVNAYNASVLASGGDPSVIAPFADSPVSGPG